jgi:hypothetical protein
MEQHIQPLAIKGRLISRDLFTKGFASGSGPCTCTSSCCGGGVYVDVGERDRILDHANLIKKYMDQTQTRDERLWFEGWEEEDGDFASGRCVGTSVLSDKCAFLDGLGACTIQKATTAEGMGRWALKPLYCILYPLEISDGVVNFDPMLQDEQSCCSITDKPDIPVYEACRDELVHLLGEEGFHSLHNHYVAVHQSAQRNI